MTTHSPDTISDLPTNLPQEATLSPQETSSLKRLVAVTALATLPTIVATTTAAEMVVTRDTNPISAIEHFSGKLLNGLGLTDCPPVPANATLIQIRQEVNEPHTSHYSEAKARAVASGLTFAEGLRPINAVLNSETPAEATRYVSDYMEQEYGFSIELDMPDDKQKDIDISRYNQSLLSMMAYTSLLPTELVRTPDLLRIKITDLYDQTKYSIAGKETGQAGLFKPNTRTVTIDINYVDDSGIFIHEVVGHGIQDTVCTGAEFRDDPAISSQNPSGFAYSNTEASQFNEAAKEVTASGYGTTNVREDTAELTRAFIAGDESDFQNLNGTSAGNKLAVILDRFNKIAPGSSAYLAAVRPEFSAWQHAKSAPPTYTSQQ